MADWTTWLAIATSLVGLRVLAHEASAAETSGENRATVLGAPIRLPLEGPPVITGTFGENRSNHFHAGVDFSTGEKVGRPVYAPLDGRLERVRASGVGYGRSLYIRARDGRLVVLGHLDAFDEPIASYVASVQESSGQYEQDLWPDSITITVHAGQRVGWSGQSGVGVPHLHLELRRGDVAYNPLRGGLEVADHEPPRILKLTLEPLDDSSFAERGAAPFSLVPGDRPESLAVEGRVRAIVEAIDRVGQGTRLAAPWSVAIEDGETRVEARFDSLSWATDMAEVEDVYDRGRAVRGGDALVLWAPSGFRPRPLLTSNPVEAEAGTLRVRADEPPHTLRIVVQDAAGNRVERTEVLRAPAHGGPDTTRVQSGAGTVGAERRFELAMLPGGFLRVTLRGAPPGSRGVRIALECERGRGTAATLAGTSWTAVLPIRGTLISCAVVASGRDGAGHVWRESLPAMTLMPADQGVLEAPGRAVFSWHFPEPGTYEPTALLADLDGQPGAPATELTPASRVFALLPATLPLRRPVRVRLALGADNADARVALYQDSGEGWSFMTAALDSGRGSITADTRHLGRFALFADHAAPRVRVFPAPHRAPRGPYSTWMLRARIVEEGSGLDVRASHFIVDGHRVPTEWDPESHELRWRPLHPPSKGAHRYQLVATDHVGNTSRASGRVVLD